MRKTQKLIIYLGSTSLLINVLLSDVTEGADKQVSCHVSLSQPYTRL